MSWSRIVGVFLRYFFVARKGLHQLSDIFYWPIVDILIWGLTSFWIQSQANVTQLPLVLLTGLIFWQIVWRGSVDISTSLLLEFWHRNLVNLFSTPLKLSEWITGLLLLGLCKLVITVTFASLAIYFLFSLNVFTIGWAFLPFALSLYIFGYALSFLSASLIIRWGGRVEMLAWMAAFMFEPFSAVFYPIDILPQWAQTISWFLPTTYIFEGMRSMLDGGGFPAAYFWTSMSLNALYLTASLSVFKIMFQKTIDKGLARLE